MGIKENKPLKPNHDRIDSITRGNDHEMVLQMNGYSVEVHFEQKEFKFLVIVDETKPIPVTYSANNDLFELVGQHNNFVYSQILKAVHEFHFNGECDFPIYFHPDG